MYETLANTDTGLSALAVLIWLLAGQQAGRVVEGRASRRARTAMVARVLLVLGALVVAVRVAELGVMAVGVGWEFPAGQLSVGVPVLLAGAVPAVASGVPALRAVGRTGFPERGGVAAVQVGALAAVVAFWVELVVRPVAFDALALLLSLAVLALGAVLLHVRQARRRITPRGPGSRALRALGVTVALIALAVGGLVTASRTSVLPDTYAMTGSAPVAGRHEMGTGGVDTTSLTGDVAGVPDRRFTLTAAPTTTRLTSGAVVEGWAFNGSLPGPELRVHQGELVEVTLVNQLPGTRVTLHWHGVDVANAADGVAGLTQEAVPPGGRFVYRFRAPDVGTYWYHSHQQSDEAVQRGLFGAIVVLPPGASLDPAVGERTVLSHRWRDVRRTRHASFGTADGIDTAAREPLAAGTPVRLRVVNTDNSTLSVAVAGTDFRVAAVDGHEVHEPGALRDRTVRIGSGGRADVTFTMPDHPVALGGVGTDAGPTLVLGPGGAPPQLVAGPPVDLLAYGTPAPTPFDASTPVDREFTSVLDERPGFYDGSFDFLFTINSASFPDTPMPMVREGDLVRVRFVNRSHSPHPMHLHGHHALVLSRNDAPASGSPWWEDTLEVLPGETYEIAFRADNPGLWMDHCHNLEHAASGMTMHLGYEGVTSSIQAGHHTGNEPE